MNCELRLFMNTYLGEASSVSLLIGSCFIWACCSGLTIMGPWPDKRSYLTFESQSEDEGNLSHNMIPSIELTLL
jgi:hypothetical protein